MTGGDLQGVDSAGEGDTRRTGEPRSQNWKDRCLWDAANGYVCLKIVPDLKRANWLLGDRLSYFGRGFARNPGGGSFVNWLTNFWLIFSDISGTLRKRAGVCFETGAVTARYGKPEEAQRAPLDRERIISSYVTCIRAPDAIKLGLRQHLKQLTTNKAWSKVQELLTSKSTRQTKVTVQLEMTHQDKWEFGLLKNKVRNNGGNGSRNTSCTTWGDKAQEVFIVLTKEKSWLFTYFYLFTFSSFKFIPPFGDKMNDFGS